MDKSNKLSDKDIYEILSEFSDIDEFILCDKKGEGGFGEIRKIISKKNNKEYSLKIISPRKESKPIKEPIKEFRGKNIIKIIAEKICENNYYVYIMEYSPRGDLERFIKDFYKKDKENKKYKENKKNKENKDNKKKDEKSEDVRDIKNYPYLEEFGNNLLRFFARQIFYAMRTFYQLNLVHFDIKPSNILIFPGLYIKIIDFSLLKNISENEDPNIPGGTYGYRTPESYCDDEIEEYELDILRKQDYFAIGATLFKLKYNKSMLKYDKNISDSNDNRNEIIANRIIDSLYGAIHYIKSQKYQDKDFTKFLCDLIEYKPEDRADFEHIIRNKWLNKNSEEIDIIAKINENYEDDLISELRKSDFLINNCKYYRKKFEKINIENEKNYIYNKRGKFKFRKKN